MSRRALFIIGIFVLLGVMTAGAQEAAEFRGTGGQISVIPKKSTGFSGSLGFSLSQSDGALSGFGGKRYAGSLGGSLVQDRLWFFASAEQQSARMGPVSAEGYGTNAVDAKVMASLGDRQSLTALFAQGRQHAPAAVVPGIGNTTPSSFLSMRYTGVVSDNMLFTASLSRRTAQQPNIFIAPANAGE